MTWISDPSYDPAVFDRFEKDGWERRADAYQSFWAPITARAGVALLDAVGIRPGDRVLDVGCGPGHLARAAADRGARAEGVDVAAAMVDLARRLHPDLRFRVGSADRLPFDEGSFDGVLLAFVLLHVGRQDAALREAFRVLAPGGGLGLTLWDTGDRNALHAAILGAAERAGVVPPADLPAGPPGFYADDDLVALIESAGFRDVRVEHTAFDEVFRDAEALWSGMLGAGVRFPPLVRAQPAEVQARIRQEFDAYVAAWAGRNGALRLPVSIQVAVGRRP